MVGVGDDCTAGVGVGVWEFGFDRVLAIKPTTARMPTMKTTRKIILFINGLII